MIIAVIIGTVRIGVVWVLCVTVSGTVALCPIVQMFYRKEEYGPVAATFDRKFSDYAVSQPHDHFSSMRIAWNSKKGTQINWSFSYQVIAIAPVLESQ